MIPRDIEPARGECLDNLGKLYGVERSGQDDNKFLGIVRKTHQELLQKRTTPPRSSMTAQDIERILNEAFKAVLRRQVHPDD